MTIVRDYLTDTALADKFIEEAKLSGKVWVLDDNCEELYQSTDDCVFLLTSLPSGIVGYHDRFIKKCKDKVSRWVVVLFNDNKATYNQLHMFLSSTGARFEIIVPEEEKSYTELGNIKSVNNKKILVWSGYPSRGKRTLVNLLESMLEDSYSIEISEEADFENVIENTDASKIIIVGKYNDEFSINIPEGVQPFYVKTFPDSNVQSYLRKEKIHLDILRALPENLGWSTEQAKDHIFFISPLYETWRCTSNIPRFDENFVMWDDFGLPIMLEEVNNEEIEAFLSQFNETERLVKNIAR